MCIHPIDPQLMQEFVNECKRKSEIELRPYKNDLDWRDEYLYRLEQECNNGHDRTTNEI